MAQEQKSGFSKSALKRSSQSESGGKGISRSRTGAAFLGLVSAFVALTYYAFVQAPRPDSYAPVTFAEQFLYPIERNAFARLPLVTGKINDVHAIANTEIIWLVGDGGLILRSADDGLSWQQLTFKDGPVLDGQTASESSSPLSPLTKRIKLMQSAHAQSAEPAKDEEINALLESALNGVDSRRSKEGYLEQAQSSSGGGLPVRTSQIDQNFINDRTRGKQQQGTPIQVVDPPAPNDASQTDLSVIGATESAVPVTDTSFPGLNAVEFQDQTTGIIVGDGGIILVTSNGGDTWQRAKSGVNTVLLGVTFTDNEAIAVGAAAVILRSSGDHIQWMPESHDLNQEVIFYSVSYINEASNTGDSHAIAVGSDGSMVVRNNFSGQGESALTSASWITANIGDPRRLRSVLALPANKGIAVGSSGIAIDITLGASSRLIEGFPPDRLNDVARMANGQLLAVGQTGAILRSDNIAKSWNLLEYRSQNNRTDIQTELNAISVIDDNRLIVVGDNGLIIRSDDGGDSWRRQSIDWQHSFAQEIAKLGIDESAQDDQENSLTGLQVQSLSSAFAYSRYPSIWYLFVCLVAAICAFLFAKREPPVTGSSQSVADALASDKPLEPNQPDPLNFGPIARGLSRFMRNPSTKPPLTTAITGKWGTGKSSLMNLLYHDLREFGFTPVWFNAWHHQKGEQLLASLYANIRTQAIPGFFHFYRWAPVGIMFRINLLSNRIRKHRFASLVLFLIFLIPLIYLLNDVDTDFEGMWAALKDGQAWDKIMVALLGSAPLAALFRTMRGFGLDPMRLVSLGAAGSEAGAKVDPSARQKFANEFGEVSQSLDLGRMVIFIDDLDRCSKENVVDILESINFLSVSGDCYIVLGMDEKWVKLCVTDHFEKIAKDDPAFADNYLEKMVNIRVPVPALQEDGVQRLFESSTQGTVEVGQNGSSFLASLKQQLMRFRSLIAALILIGIWSWMTHSQEPEVVSVKKPPQLEVIKRWKDVKIEQIEVKDGVPQIALNVTQAQSKNTNDPVNGSLQLILEASKAQIDKGIIIGKIGKGDAAANLRLIVDKDASAAESNQAVDVADSGSVRLLDDDDTAEFLSGKSYQSITQFIIPGIVALFLIYGFVIFAMKQPGRIVQDSADFTKALGCWRNWIIFVHPTPRSLKRFLNRVRYLAMRYRPDDESESEGWFARLFNTSGRDRSRPISPEENVYSIDEAGLVALSAIYAINPSWVVDDDKFTQVKSANLEQLLIEHFSELTNGELPVGASGKSQYANLTMDEWANRMAEGPTNHNQMFDSIVSDTDRRKFLKMVSV